MLALVAIPRAVFMLVGGALTDRLSPRVIMLCSNIIRMLLVAALALLTVTGLIELWMLYTFALLFGLVDAFFFPAQSAMIPRLLGTERLQTGNALIQGTAQLSVFLGPVLAGTLIALLDGGGDRGRLGRARHAGHRRGVRLRRAPASSSRALTLAMPSSSPRRVRPAQAAGAKSGLFSSIGEGLALVWQDKALRYYFGLIALVNLLMTGPISVGIPVLADTRFTGGAAAFGIILSAFGGGSLVGVIVAGVRRRPSARRFPMLMLGLTAAMGIGLALLGLLSSLVAGRRGGGPDGAGPGLRGDPVHHLAATSHRAPHARPDDECAAVRGGRAHSLYRAPWPEPSSSGAPRRSWWERAF